MPKKKTNEEFLMDIDTYLNDEWNVLEEYKGSQTRLKFLHLKCQNVSFIRPTDILYYKEIKCDHCSKLEDYSVVKSYIEIESNSDCTLISNMEDYENSKSELEIKCACGNHFKTNLIYFRHENKRQCDQCGLHNRGDLRRHSYQYVKEYIDKEGFGLLSDSYVNSKENLSIKCPNNHVNQMTFNDFQSGSRCRQCYLEEVRKNSIRTLQRYLRDSVTLEWKKQSMKESNYVCVLTGDQFHHIHHLYSYGSIIRDTLLRLNLEAREYLSDYKSEEIELIIETAKELHMQHPLGVCLREDIHTLFHQLYGFTDNTPEQFEEFSLRYRMGEFQPFLKVS